MSKYLIRASYTQSGLQGLLKEGGSSRKKALSATIEGLGGTLESFYYSFGSDDLLIIADLPDNISAASASLHIAAVGALDVAITVLLTPEEIDAAANTEVAYRAPGE
ncbi:MAG: GYD domain-containing protein [Gammaproteobacteria bacterium]|nr:GYD domain-containing protein [Gammaproteobacteria bacterium]